MIQLVPFTPADIDRLIGWIPSLEALQLWTASSFDFPLTREHLEGHLRDSAQRGDRLIFKAVSITWFTWKARFRGPLLLPSDVIEYDRVMNETFPLLTGSLAVLAALKHSSYTRAKKIVDHVYDLDERVAKSATLVLKNEKSGPEALGALHQEARDLEAAVNERFAEVMADI